MSSHAAPPVAPTSDERGLASWEPADLAELVLPAWDEFAEIAAAVDLDAPSRIRGWTASREGRATVRRPGPGLRCAASPPMLCYQPQVKETLNTGQQRVNNARLAPGGQC